MPPGCAEYIRQIPRFPTCTLFLIVPDSLILADCAICAQRGQIDERASKWELMYDLVC
jgi:hypothetical protein